MKLTDYVVDFLADLGIKHIFGLTGGAAVHLFDSAAKNPKIKPIFTQHEQAAAMAAVAYARVSNNLGAVFVTTGPGGTNALTGVAAAWLDSIPCLYISGQSRLAHTTRGKGVRQLGSQQLDIVPVVDAITKYAVMVDDPQMIKYHLQKAVFIARSKRPGPVWIDIPLDLQWTSIEPKQLPRFEPSQIQEKHPSGDSVEKQVKQCLKLIQKAKRPILLAGYGIRLAHAEAEFRQLIKILQLPFLSTWNTSDLMPTNNGFYVGCPGTEGQRGANLAIQNCDLLLSIGSHLSISLTGTLYDAFAREAKIIVVDVDPAELKNRTVRVDLPINCDAKEFLQEMLKQAGKNKCPDITYWLKVCSKYKSYNAIPAQWRERKKYVNPYVFIDVLSEELKDRDVVVVDGGGTVTQITFQAFKVKPGQRLMIDSGLCAMGSGLPEGIGAYFGSGGRQTVCLCGDGSMQLNIQELQTIVHHKLPVKIFVFNNSGYLAIRHTQDGFLQSKYVGSDKNGGLSLPDFQKVARAYGIRATRIKNHRQLRKKIRWVLKEDRPVLCEIMISPDQQVIPRQGFKKKPDGTFAPRPLEDMYPFLERKEFLENMVIKPWAESKS